jgi:integrase
VPQARRRSFGKIRQLPSGMFQASYVGPDKKRYIAPTTFLAKREAEAWLTTQQATLIESRWKEPAKPEPTTTTVGSFAETWLTEAALRPRTRRLYRGLLDGLILPTFGSVGLCDITTAMVRDWHTGILIGENGKPRKTRRAHAYGLLRTIFNAAIDSELPGVLANPCRIKGAGSTKRAVKIEPASKEEIAAMAQAMPPKYALMVLLGAWCALRLGELSELRRKDIDTKHGVIKVRRAVSFVDGEFIVGEPKSEAGKRDVHVPPNLLPVLSAHLLEHCAPGRDGLLFPAPRDPSTHLNPSSFEWHWRKARTVAGRPTMRFHDCRHTGATMAAQVGATMAELQARLGHSTAHAASLYQHATKERDAEIARRLSAMMAPVSTADVVTLPNRSA